MSCLCLYVSYFSISSCLCLVVYREVFFSSAPRFHLKISEVTIHRSSRVMTPSLLVSSSSKEAVAMAASTCHTQQRVNDASHGVKSDRKSSLGLTSMSFCFFGRSAQFLFQQFQAISASSTISRFAWSRSLCFSQCTPSKTTCTFLFRSSSSLASSCMCE